MRALFRHSTTISAHKVRVLGGAALAVLAVAATGPASAETLREAMIKAYNTNPTLAAQRSNLRAIDENVPIARSSAFPQVQLQSQHTEQVKVQANSFLAPDRQLTAQTTVNFPIYSGGQIKNSIAAAKTRVEAGRASLRGTEADLFTNVVGAYMDVIRDEAIVGFNQQNVRVLDVNFQASKDRFEVGDLTRTDVAQSDARLALARSQLQTAEARLISSREAYIRLVGSVPGTLDRPPPLPNLPADPDKAVDVALIENPTLLAARKSSDAAGFDVKTARANRLPTLGAFVNGSYFNFLGTLGSVVGQQATQAGTAASAGLQLSMPLYQGGRPAAQIRQAQARRSQALEQITETERGVIAQARSAYAVWQSSLEVIQSAQTAVDANKLALEGVRAENSVGNRTILDILDAEQEFLNSQVTLVTAQRDAYVAGFALLAAMGRAEAKDLGLDGGPLYDPVANYDRVKGNIFDWGDDPAPQPVATSTAQTPPQTAILSRPVDPAASPPVDRGAGNPANTPQNR